MLKFNFLTDLMMGRLGKNTLWRILKVGGKEEKKKFIR
jgi:hypothetical protein